MPKAYTEDEFRVNFMSKIGPPNKDGCTEWMGSRNWDGYGQVRHHRKARHCTHVALEMYDGKPVLPETHVMHSCDNPPCVYGPHLKRGTPAENLADMSRKGRAPRGEKQGRSKLTEANVREIRAQRIARIPVRDIALLFSVSESNIYYILRQHTWTHI